MSLDAIVIIGLFVACFMFFYFKGKHKLTKNIKEGHDFLQSNQKDPEVSTTSSGLQYRVLEKSEQLEQTETPESNLTPNLDSTVTVHYHGTLINGTVFDSSVNRGQSISFKLGNVITGWKEGLLLMQKGDKYRFFIPHDLAYGDRKAGAIEPGSTLVFDVTLIDFY